MGFFRVVLGRVLRAGVPNDDITAIVGIFRERHSAFVFKARPRVRSATTNGIGAVFYHSENAVQLSFVHPKNREFRFSEISPAIRGTDENVLRSVTHDSRSSISFSAWFPSQCHQ